MFDTISKLEHAIQDICTQLGIADAEIMFEHPADLSHGDLATNVAMRYGKTLGKNPRELADFIVASLPSFEDISEVSVDGPGFINIFLSPEIFYEKIKTINQDYGKNTLHQGKTILVEHSSPNLFKPFHIGHVMNNTVGESIVRLAEFSGANVTRLSYPSDVSLGIGKAVWAFLQDGVETLDTFPTISEKLTYMGECYVKGNKAFEENEQAQQEIRDITKKIYAKEQSVEWDAYEKGKNINLEYFKNETARLGSRFDAFVYESEAGEVGKKIVEDNLGKVFEYSEGAVIFDGEKRGLHARVFINGEGYPTYEAKDIGLLDIKFSKFDPDTSILITDNEQGPYYKVVLEAAGEIHREWKEKTIHRTHGRMTFKGKKMSSRLGGVPLASEVLELVGDEVRERIEDTSDTQKIDTIAIAALKFSILKAMAGKNIDFDPETSLSFEGDSGPYLQYTIARCNSIIEKAQQEGFGAEKERKEAEDITTLEKLLCRFEETVIQAETVWEPHHVATCCLLLAREFNSWYGNTKIVDSQNKNMGYNLWLTEAVAITLTNGLHILGIKALERM